MVAFRFLSLRHGLCRMPKAPSDEGAVTANAVTGGENKEWFRFSRNRWEFCDVFSPSVKNQRFLPPPSSEGGFSRSAAPNGYLSYQKSLLLKRKHSIRRDSLVYTLQRDCRRLFPFAPCRKILNSFAYEIWFRLFGFFSLFRWQGLSDFLLPFCCHNKLLHYTFRTKQTENLKCIRSNSCAVIIRFTLLKNGSLVSMGESFASIIAYTTSNSLD